MRAQPTGFLGDYRGFRRTGNGALVYRQRGADLSHYQTFLLEPLEFWGGTKDLGAADQTHLRNYFRKAITEAVGGRYSFTHEPGSDVIRIRAALSGVRPTESQIVESGLPPAGTYNEPSITLERRLGFAAVEADLTDSISKDRLFAVVARRQAERRPTARKWGHIEDIIDVWATNFRAQLDTWQRPPSPENE